MKNIEAISVHFLLKKVKESLDLPVGERFVFGTKDGVPNEISKEYRYKMPEKVLWAINKSIRNLSVVVKENEELTNDFQEGFLLAENIERKDITSENQKEIDERYQKYMQTSEDVAKLSNEFYQKETQEACVLYKVIDNVDWDELICPDVIREFLEINLKS